MLDRPATPPPFTPIVPLARADRCETSQAPGHSAPTTPAAASADGIGAALQQADTAYTDEIFSTAPQDTPLTQDLYAPQLQCALHHAIAVPAEKPLWVGFQKIANQFSATTTLFERPADTLHFRFDGGRLRVVDYCLAFDAAARRLIFKHVCFPRYQSVADSILVTDRFTLDGESATFACERFLSNGAHWEPTENRLSGEDVEDLVTRAVRALEKHGQTFLSVPRAASTGTVVGFTQRSDYPSTWRALAAPKESPPVE